MAEQKLVIFDFDGVIAHGFDQDERFFLEQYQLLSQKHSLKPILNDLEFGHFTNLSVWQQIRFCEVKLYRFPFLSLDVGKIFWRAWKRASASEQVESVLSNLNQKYIVTIASRNYSFIIAQFLRKHGLKKYFRSILGRDHSPSKTKNLQRLLKKYRVDPRNSILVTDTTKDIQDAQDCDIRTIAVTYGLQTRDVLEVFKPEIIVDSPREISLAIASLLD